MLSLQGINSLVILDDFFSAQHKVDLLLGGKGWAVAVTGGIGFNQFPSFSEECVDLILSILGTRSRISGTDDLDLLKFVEIDLPFFHQPS
jgi:hypothetical protein